MSRDDVLRLLRLHRDELHDEFGVRSVALFGSFARDEAGPASDLDLLVEFDSPVTFLGYMALVDRLESVFGRSVDLATAEDLRPRIRPYVERELIRVA